MITVQPFSLPDGTELEPMMLLDISKSTSYPVAKNSFVTRKELMMGAMGTIVGRLSDMDSQAAEEREAGNEDDEGGLWTVAFNGEFISGFEKKDDYHILGDLNRNNYQEKLNGIHWQGGTKIMPGFEALLKKYKHEFVENNQEEARPLLLVLVLTDGEAADSMEFGETVSRSKGDVYFVIGIVGYGYEHDETLRVYKEIEKKNAHVRVISFDSVTDPNIVANTFLSMIQ